MDGLLVVDKPVGPTSHDVVARARRLLGERTGHTGTLDPMARGVLPLLVGRATRLARFLSSAGKSYEAVVRLGVETDSYDAAGAVIGATHGGPFPARDDVDRALDAFRGTFLQQPPLFSAKKVAGQRSYKAARAHARRRDAADLPVLPDPPVLPAPVTVTVHRLECVSLADDLVTLTIDCSAGFYVRSLAHDLGERLGTGAHLAALQRTRSGQFTLADATGLDVLERDPEAALARLIPMALMLPDLASVVLTPQGIERALHGRDLGPGDAETGVSADTGAGPSPFFIRLLDAGGDLVGIAEPGAAPGLLHPSVVLK